MDRSETGEEVQGVYQHAHPVHNLLYPHNESENKKSVSVQDNSSKPVMRHFKCQWMWGMTNLLFQPCNLCWVMVDIVILSESWPVFSGQISWGGGGYWPMTSSSSGVIIISQN